MAIFDIYSKRRKKAAAKGVDVYQYDEIPGKLRVQVVHIWRDIVGHLARLRDEPVFVVTRAILCREYGAFQLFAGPMDNGFEEIMNFFLKTADTDQALDVIELTFRRIDETYASTVNCLTARGQLETGAWNREVGRGLSCGDECRWDVLAGSEDTCE